jgi:hypothetical protein
MQDKVPRNVEMWDWNDHDTMRTRIFDGVRKEMESAFPMSYGGTRVELEGLDYKDPEDYDFRTQKDAILGDKFLARRLRGTLVLKDEATGDELERKTLTLAKVPWLTQRGTFIHGGSEYVVANQARLLPGIYTRARESGEIETHFNVQRGTGNAFRIMLEPETAQYRMRVQQANLHLYSILHDMGEPDEDLAKRWGPGLLERNKAKYDPKVLPKAYERLVPKRLRPLEGNPSREEMARMLREAFDRMEVNERVARRNMPNLFDREKAAGWRKAAAVLDRQIDHLLSAKEKSDAGQYGAKHLILVRMMADAPDEFAVDSETSSEGDPAYMGITHVPTGFRFHMPKGKVPATVPRLAKEAAWDPTGEGEDGETEGFEPELTPDQLSREYSVLYGRQGPRIGGMKAWPKEWMPPETNQLGWLGWYFDWANGRRGPEDVWQISRWKRMRAIHIPAFRNKPTPRRAFMLRLWALDPEKHLDKETWKTLSAEMDAMQAKAQEKWDMLKQSFAKSDYNVLAVFLNNSFHAGIPVDAPAEEVAAAIRSFLEQLGYPVAAMAAVEPVGAPPEPENAVDAPEAPQPVEAASLEPQT